MSQAERLLNSLATDIPTHTHVVKDTDTYFVIDPDTRMMSNGSTERNAIMQFDHNSQCYTFELPRYIDNHDMTLCDRVRVHFNNVDGESYMENADVAELTDLKVNPKNPDTVICSWTIDRRATQLAGTLNFLVQYICTASDGTLVYEWHTDIYSDVDVKTGRNNGEAAVAEYSNILEQWYTRLFGAKDSIVTDLIAAADAEKEAIAIKGEETLATIPADYTETYNMAREALRSKAGAVILSSEGECVSVDDSSDSLVNSLKLYGRTTQVRTTGKQLLRITKTDGDVEGAKIFVHDDGSFTINGTVAKNTSFPIGKFKAEGELILSLTVTGSRNASYIYIGMEPDDNIGWYDSDVTFTGDGVERTLYAVIIAGTYYDTTFYPMIRFASNKNSNYEPYSGGVVSPSPDWPQELVSINNTTTYIFGKNLLNENLLVGGSFVKNNDGTYMFTKLENSGTSATCPLNLPAGDYVLSWGEVERTCESYRVYINYADGTTQLTGLTILGTNKLVLSTEVGIKDIRLSLASNVTTDSYVKFAWLQIEAGTEATEYEPYKGVQTIALNRTLRSLTALYWDGSANAGVKEVVRDEIDLERGVLIQRIGFNTMNSGVYTSYMLSGKTGRGQLVVSPSPAKDQSYNGTLCNVAIRNDIALEAVDGEYYENPANIVFVGAIDDDEATMRAKYPDFELLYVLETPIETPLTEEEIAAFRRLKTNYPNTTVLNDAGAWMELKYNPDTKIYFENLPKASDAQVQAAVDAWLTAHYSNAEGVSF